MNSTGQIKCNVLTCGWSHHLEGAGWNDICKKLKKNYGNLTNLIKKAKNKKDLEKKLLEFKGVGPVTVRIFLRDLKSIK